MALRIEDEGLVRLIRALAELEGTSPTEAVVIAVREALRRRREAESPQETAARIRAELGIELINQARKPLPRSVFNEMSGEADELPPRSTTC